MNDFRPERAIYFSPMATPWVMNNETPIPIRPERAA